VPAQTVEPAQLVPVERSALVGAVLPAAVVDQLVASLAAHESGPALPGPAARAAAWTTTRAGQAGLAVGGVLVVLAALLLVMTVLGHLV
jgi:hypothetical protein